jgi:hypothetical protein
MHKFKLKVVAIYTRNGDFQSRTVEYFDSTVEAYTRFGKLAATSNGVIILDEQGTVWAKHEPAQLEKATDQEVRKFQLYMDPDYQDIRENVHG